LQLNTFFLNQNRSIRKGITVLVGVLAFGCLLSYAHGIDTQDSTTKKGTTQPEIVQIGKDATVNLVVKTTDGVLDSGSGFFIRQDLIVTNIHVVSGIHGKSISCIAKQVNQPIEYNIKGVMASDPEHDLVILKVDGVSKNVLSLGESEAVILDEEVFAIGTHGNNATGEMVKGTISRITPDFFRIQATLPPGYSGGPLLNDAGKVVGICVTGGITKNYGYVIPSNHLMKLLQDMPAQEKPLDKWREERFIQAYAIVKQGDKSSALGDVKQAITAYNTAIGLKPDFAAAFARRGSAKYRLGNYKGSIKDYDAAIALGMDYAAIYVNRGVVKRTLKNYKGTIKDYNKAISLDPESVEAYLNRGNLKSDLGDYKTAIEDYNTAIRLKPKGMLLAASYLKRANTKSDMNDYVGAIEDYNRAIHQKSNNTLVTVAYLNRVLPVAYLNRGLAKSKFGDAKSAIEDYGEVIRLKPSNAMLAETYAHRATAKSKLGDNIGAIQDYDNAIRLATENTGFSAYAYSRRAAAKLSINDNRGAIDDCNIAIRISPELAEAYKTRGDANSNLRNYKNAIKDYDSAIYLKPDYIKAYYKRGNAKVEIDNVFEAKIDFRSALKFAKSESPQSLIDEIEKALNPIK